MTNDWAKDRARAVVNSVGFSESAEAAIAEALQQVADECADVADWAALDQRRTSAPASRGAAMASEWAKAKAIESPGFKEAAHRSATSDADYDSFMNDFAEALDAARVQGLEEAFALATEHCEHGEFTHMGRYECIDALRVDIRVRIREMKR